MSEDTQILQKDLLRKYSERQTAFLKKGFDNELFQPDAGSYIYTCALSGSSELKNLHFDFSAGCFYRLNIRWDAVKKNYNINEMPDGLKVCVERKDGKGAVEVFMPRILRLFDLRNKIKGSKLSLLENTRYSSLKEDDVEAEFYFRAHSKNYKILESVMELDHPNAEAIFDKFLGTIDDCFDEYYNFGYKSEKKFRKDLFSKLVDFLKENKLCYSIKSDRQFFSRIFRFLVN